MLDKLSYLASGLSLFSLFLALRAQSRAKLAVRKNIDNLAEWSLEKAKLEAEISSYKNYYEVLELSNARLHDAINFMKVRVPEIDMGSVDAIIRGDKIW